MNDDEITLKENEDRRRIMREQSDQISKLGAEIEQLKKLLFQQRKIHEWSTTLLELDLAEIQAAWCDFDAVVAELEVRNSAIRHHEQRVEVAEVKVSNLRERLELEKEENVKLREACEAQLKYTEEAQETLTSYLRPGGIEANCCLGLLLSQFDGPSQRALFKQTKAALDKGEKK